MNLENTIAKLHELQPHVWWAAERWAKQCHEENLHFDVREVHRTQERQLSLIAQGRKITDVWDVFNRGWISYKSAKEAIKIIKENPSFLSLPVVTWTDQSFHGRRLACDILPINCSVEDIERVGSIYGITRPLAGAPYYDENHFQFDEVGSFPIILRAEDKLRALQRRLQRSSDAGKQIILRVIKRLQKRNIEATDDVV